MGLRPVIINILGVQRYCFLFGYAIFSLEILLIWDIFVILQQNDEDYERTRGKKSRCVYGAGAADV